MNRKRLEGKEGVEMNVRAAPECCLLLCCEHRDVVRGVVRARACVIHEFFQVAKEIKK